jgi:hypothetical protein
VRAEGRPQELVKKQMAVLEVIPESPRPPALDAAFSILDLFLGCCFGPSSFVNHQKHQVLSLLPTINKLSVFCHLRGLGV